MENSRQRKQAIFPTPLLSLVGRNIKLKTLNYRMLWNSLKTIKHHLGNRTTKVYNNSKIFPPHAYSLGGIIPKPFNGQSSMVYIHFYQHQLLAQIRETSTVASPFLVILFVMNEKVTKQVSRDPFLLQYSADQTESKEKKL